MVSGELRATLQVFLWSVTIAALDDDRPPWLPAWLLQKIEHMLQDPAANEKQAKSSGSASSSLIGGGAAHGSLAYRFASIPNAAGKECVEPPSKDWTKHVMGSDMKVFSQNGEDGILLTIFENIGVIGSPPYYVEARGVGCGSSWGGGLTAPVRAPCSPGSELAFSLVPPSQFGTEACTECNSRVIRDLAGWTGLLMDGSHSNPAINLNTERISPENINQLFAKYKVPYEFDLLSIDV